MQIFASNGIQNFKKKLFENMFFWKFGNSIHWKNIYEVNEFSEVMDPISVGLQIKL